MLPSFFVEMEIKNRSFKRSQQFGVLKAVRSLLALLGTKSLIFFRSFIRLIAARIYININIYTPSFWKFKGLKLIVRSSNQLTRDFMQSEFPLIDIVSDILLRAVVEHLKYGKHKVATFILKEKRIFFFFNLFLGFFNRFISLFTIFRHLRRKLVRNYYSFTTLIYSLSAVRFIKPSRLISNFSFNYNGFELSFLKEDSNYKKKIFRNSIGFFESDVFSYIYNSSLEALQIESVCNLNLLLYYRIFLFKPVHEI